MGLTYTLKKTLFRFSVIRELKSSQSKKAKRSVPSSSKASKRCGEIENGANPCGGCRDTIISYFSIGGVATLRARDFECSSVSPCFGGLGLCQKLTRHFELIVGYGNRSVSKTLEVPVACICARLSGGWITVIPITGIKMTKHARTFFDK